MAGVHQAPVHAAFPWPFYCMQIAFGAGHQLCEVNSFLPFASGLAFEVAAAVTQATSASRAL